VDYLVDQVARQEVEPPENQLQKVLGPAPTSEKVSEHELRFLESVEKLSVPDWYASDRLSVESHSLPRRDVPSVFSDRRSDNDPERNRFARFGQLLLLTFH